MNTFTCTNLISMGRHIPAPFYISIPINLESMELRIDSILRIVPGKRMVGISSWQGKPVIVKLFFHEKHWQRNQSADIHGIELLKQANIPSPKILHQGTTADNQGGVLLIEYLEGLSLTQLLEDASNEQNRKTVLEMAIESIAQCHQGNIWQADIHLDNFILANSQVYLLDGGAVRAAKGEIDEETRMNNLALFFVQFPVAMDSGVAGLLSHYRHQGLELSEQVTAGLQRRLVESRTQRVSSYESKLFRSTTAHRCESSASRFVIYDRRLHSPEFEDFLANPDEKIETAQLLKDGNASTVAEVSIDGRKLVIKRYNIKKAFHGIRGLFTESRARKSWRNAHVLEMLGISTAHAYACIEERFLWVIPRRAYFICEKIEAEQLLRAFEVEQASNSSSAKWLPRFKELFQLMKDYKITHGDMKATNFIFKDELLYVLDLDAMKRHESDEGFGKKYTKDLERFRKNWQGTRLAKSAEELVNEVSLASSS